MLPMVIFPRLGRAAAVICIIRGMERVVQEEVLTQLVQVLLLAIQSVQALECNLKNTQVHLLLFLCLSISHLQVNYTCSLTYPHYEWKNTLLC